jgi:hypothetical protein
MATFFRSQGGCFTCLTVHVTIKKNILGKETFNLTKIVENVSVKGDCFKLCKELPLCKWFIYIQALSLCSLFVEPPGIFDDM